MFFKSRRETTVFYHFCFREGLKTRTHVGIQEDGFNPFYIPKVNEFFEGLISLLQQRGDCVNENTDGGDAEFLARHLGEEYKRTLRVMYGRVRSGPRTTAPESTYSGFGTFNTDINELQITITCNTKQ